ncbi:MAG: hypothetical protein Q7R76_04255 [Candidatus Woesearchaeota archaeon]|nr:hypothetical protein [Candidatus Woesearchaeota archaeon]
MVETLNTLVEPEPQDQKRSSLRERCKEYLRGFVDPANARLYGTFQERAALNITQFPNIQGSLLIRMGLVYPIISHFVERAGIPKDAHTDLYSIAINYHTWVAGYLAYLTEIQLGMSKYPIELASKTAGRIKNYVSSRLNQNR